MSTTVVAKLVGVAATVCAIGWGYYEYREAEEFREKVALADQFYNSCVAERKKLSQAYFLCRSWSYGHMAGSSGNNTRKRLLELAQSYAISSAESCHRELEVRTEQRRQLENELRGSDGLFHFRSDADMTRLTELRRLVETIGIDCKSLDFDIESGVAASNRTGMLPDYLSPPPTGRAVVDRMVDKKTFPEEKTNKRGVFQNILAEEDELKSKGLW